MIERGMMELYKNCVHCIFATILGELLELDVETIEFHDRIFFFG